MGLRVGERQRRSPTPPEDEPLVDSELLANQLGVGDEIPRRVLAQLRVRGALPAATLVEQDHVPLRGIEVTAVIRLDSASRPAVEEDDLLPRRVAGLLVVNGV